MADILIVVAKDFSRCPGARYQSEGDYSGEEFRSHLLAPKLREAIGKGIKLIVNLDGAAGYSTAFIEESFGGLIRNDDFTLDEVMKSLIIISDEDPSYINDINTYMEHAWKNR